MKHRVIAIAVAATLAAAGTSTFADGGKSTFTTNLTGYQETPVTLNSPGSGEFAAKISKDGTEIQYVLSYRGLTTNVLQAHIHFGRPAITGGIVLFLCTNLAPPANVPAPPACPQAPADGSTVSVSGTLTAANLLVPNVANVALPTQGIDPGAAGFAEIIAAIRNGAAYANVHTSKVPSGEIRGALGKAHDHGDEEDDND
jgi:CHRD domain-containing protein